MAGLFDDIPIVSGGVQTSPPAEHPLFADLPMKQQAPMRPPIENLTSDDPNAVHTPGSEERGMLAPFVTQYDQQGKGHTSFGLPGIIKGPLDAAMGLYRQAASPEGLGSATQGTMSPETIGNALVTAATINPTSVARGLSGKTVAAQEAPRVEPTLAPQERAPFINPEGALEIDINQLHPQIRQDLQQSYREELSRHPELKGEAANAQLPIQSPTQDVSAIAATGTGPRLREGGIQAQEPPANTAGPEAVAAGNAGAGNLGDFRPGATGDAGAATAGNPRQPIEGPPAPPKTYSGADAARAAQEEGIHLNAALASDSSTTQKLAGAATGLIGGSPLVKSAQQTLSDAEARALALARKLNPNVADDAGDAITRAGQSIKDFSDQTLGPQEQALTAKRAATEQSLTDALAAQEKALGDKRAAVETQLNAAHVARGEALANEQAAIGNGYKTKAQAAGDVARAAAKEYVDVTSKKAANKAYGAVEAKLDPDATFAMPATRKVAADLRDLMEESTGTSASRALGKVAKALENDGSTARLPTATGYQDVTRPNGLPYNGLKELRGEVGELVGNPIGKTLSQKKLSAVYGALTDDMHAALAQAGAKDEFKAATDLYKRQAKTKERLADIVGADYSAPSGTIVAKVKTLLGSQRGGDLAIAQDVKNAFGKDAWSNIAGEIAQSITPKEYQAMSGPAKQMLFNDAPQLGARLDKLMSDIPAHAADAKAIKGRVDSLMAGDEAALSTAKKTLKGRIDQAMAKDQAAYEAKRDTLGLGLGNNLDRNSGAVVNQAMLLARQNGDPVKLQKFLNSIPKAQEKELAAAWVRKMFDPDGQGPSLTKFGTEYAKYTNEGRNLLSRTDPEIRKALDNLAAVASKSKEIAKYGNPSGTARTAQIWAMLGSASGAVAGALTGNPHLFITSVVGLGTAAGMGAGTFILSAILARPASVKALAPAAAAALRAVQSPSPRHIANYNVALQQLLRVSGVAVANQQGQQ